MSRSLKSRIKSLEAARPVANNREALCILLGALDAEWEILEWVKNTLTDCEVDYQLRQFMKWVEAVEAQGGSILADPLEPFQLVVIQ